MKVEFAGAVQRARDGNVRQRGIGRSKDREILVKIRAIVGIARVVFGDHVKIQFDAEPFVVMNRVAANGVAGARVESINLQAMRIVERNDISLARVGAADLVAGAAGNLHAEAVGQAQATASVSADDVAEDAILRETIVLHADAVAIGIARNQIAFAGRSPADHVALGIKNIDPRAAIAQRVGPGGVCADVISLYDVFRTIVDRDAITDIPGDDVARGGSTTADDVAAPADIIRAIQMNARGRIGGGGPVWREADETAFDAIVVADELEAVVAEAGDGEAAKHVSGDGHPEASAEGNVCAGQMNLDDGVVPDGARVGGGAGLRIAVDGNGFGRRGQFSDRRDYVRTSAGDLEININGTAADVIAGLNKPGATSRRRHRPSWSQATWPARSCYQAANAGSKFGRVARRIGRGRGDEASVDDTTHRDVDRRIAAHIGRHRGRT